jgi:hypothetical protein
VPNRAEHIAAAIPAGIAFSLYEAPPGDGSAILWETVGGALGAVPGAALPDVIDVPSGPNHRSVAHGAIPVGGLTYLAWKHLDSGQAWLRAAAQQHRLAKLTAPSPWLAAWHGFLEVFLQILAGALAGFVAGYISHILLDLQTPCSVPLVC